MNALVTTTSIFATAAGPRLRCFLSWIWVFLALLMTSGSARANDYVYWTVHTLRMQGYVVNQLGEKVAGAHIVAKQNGKTVAETKTDEQGVFRLKVRPGRYTLMIDAPGWQSDHAEVQVGFGFKNLFHSWFYLSIFRPNFIRIRLFL